MKKIKISASIMCADMLNLKRELDALVKAGVEMFHIDIMDGEFVPNFTLGVELIKTLKREYKIPLDLHLMITRPDLKLGYFPISQGDYVSIHAESTPHIQRTLTAIKALGAKPILALNPATPTDTVFEVADDIDAVLVMTVNPGYAGQKIIPQTIEKIGRLRKELDKRGYFDTEIEADGNVSYENAVKLKQNGANILVCGSSSLFDGMMSYEEAVKILLNEG